MSEKKVRILLTDDDPLLQELMGILLERDNFSLCKVSNGQEAVEACERERFDLIVLDLVMPKMTGLEFLDWLRNEQQVDTPVLVLTSLSDGEVAATAMQSGADVVMVKPLNIQQFIEQVDRMVS